MRAIPVQLYPGKSALNENYEANSIIVSFLLVSIASSLFSASYPPIQHGLLQKGACGVS